VLAIWKEKIRQHWDSVHVYADARRDGQLSLGEGIEVHAWVRADQLRPEDFNVELVYGEAADDTVTPQHTLPMEYIRQEPDGAYRYEIRLKPGASGSIAYGIRVLPNHPALAGKHDMGLVRWA